VLDLQKRRRVQSFDWLGGELPVRGGTGEKERRGEENEDKKNEEITLMERIISCNQITLT